MREQKKNNKETIPITKSQEYFVDCDVFGRLMPKSKIINKLNLTKSPSYVSE